MKDIPKILIVEDEPIIASDIEMLLESLHYEVTDVVEDAESALKSIEKKRPDLILLDIHLEGDTDGVLLAQDINTNYQIPFVYLTSNADKQTINRVKRTQPAGFIVKPFNEKDLQSNIEIALFQTHKPSRDKENSRYMFVKSFDEYVKIDIYKLLFVKAEDNYSRLLAKDKSFILSSTLKKVEEKLPKDVFVRIHRSYIINTNFADKYKDGFVYIGAHKLPIGRSYQENFFNKINKF